MTGGALQHSFVGFSLTLSSMTCFDFPACIFDASLGATDGC